MVEATAPDVPALVLAVMMRAGLEAVRICRQCGGTDNMVAVIFDDSGWRLAPMRLPHTN